MGALFFAKQYRSPRETYFYNVLLDQLEVVMSFSIYAKLFEQVFTKKEYRILILGLDQAGKTTILNKLGIGQCSTTIPTIGFEVQTVEYQNFSFTAWDVGGQDTIRPLWRHYFQNAKGLIFVVDANDTTQIDVAKEELHRMLSEDELRDTVLLVMANKMDVPGALNIAEVTERLGLNSLRLPWFALGTCALSGDGLYEGLEWFTKQLARLK